MRLILLLSFIVGSYLNLVSQCSEEVSEIVNKIQKKIDASGAYTVNFQLDLAYVGESSQKQKGILYVEDQKFHLKLPEQSYISDGEQLCVVLQEAKEVQILGVDEDSGMTQLSPVALLKQYCSSDYLSVLLGGAKEDGKTVLHMEFTPVDKEQELFKIRISYIESSNEIYRIKTFSKDGSRMTLTATNYNFSKTLPADLFNCSSEAFKNFHIEDLR